MKNTELWKKERQEVLKDLKEMFEFIRGIQHELPERLKLNSGDFPLLTKFVFGDDEK